MTGDELLGTGAVAKLFRVSANAVKNWESAGVLPKAGRTTPGDRRVWRAGDIEAVRERVERRRANAKEEAPAAA